MPRKTKSHKKPYMHLSMWKMCACYWSFIFKRTNEREKKMQQNEAQVNKKEKDQQSRRICDEPTKKLSRRWDLNWAQNVIIQGKCLCLTRLYLNQRFRFFFPFVIIIIVTVLSMFECETSKSWDSTKVRFFFFLHFVGGFFFVRSFIWFVVISLNSKPYRSESNRMQNLNKKKSDESFSCCCMCEQHSLHVQLFVKFPSSSFQQISIHPEQFDCTRIDKYSFRPCSHMYKSTANLFYWAIIYSIGQFIRYYYCIPWTNNP